MKQYGFHYKHVGFGEENPYSIIKNNIFGTKNILEFAVLKKIKDFIFISSDKAVNPKSMLGFTKKFGDKFKVIPKSISKYFDKKILELNNIHIVNLDHNELEFLCLKGLLKKDLIKPLYLS